MREIETERDMRETEKEMVKGGVGGGGVFSSERIY